ncbi:hypothetical protein Lser_V15G29422 [Lactuca serriola]
MAFVNKKFSMETIHPSLPKYLQNFEVSEECNDLISSLPKDRGWVVPIMYQYQGFWHHTWQLQGVLAFQKHFLAQDTDILLVTAPKSGTTWLKAISFAIINRIQYPIASKNHPLLKNNSHVVVPFVEQLYADDNSNPDFSETPLDSLPLMCLMFHYLNLSTIPRSRSFICAETQKTYLFLLFTLQTS